MIRSTIVFIHLLLGLLFFVSSLFALLQGRLNMLWELSFYQSTSIVTSSIFGGGMLLLGLSLMSIGGAAAFAMSHKMSVWTLYFVSILVGLGFPAPLSWFGAFSFGLLFIQRWSERLRQPPPDS